MYFKILYAYKYCYYSIILICNIIYYCPNRLSATKKKYYLNNLLGNENDPKNICLTDSDDEDEYFLVDQCPISVTEKITNNIIFEVLIFFTCS